MSASASRPKRLPGRVLSAQTWSVMKRRTTVVSLLAIAVTSVFAQSSLQQSHIEGNVPPQELFTEFLSRDLLAFFRAGQMPSADSIQIKLLRSSPTQSGVSFPKFYAWVKVLSGSKVLQEGAVRVAAVNRTHFEVTRFLSIAQLKANPNEVGSVFPSALVPVILEKAGAK